MNRKMSTEWLTSSNICYFKDVVQKHVQREFKRAKNCKYKKNIYLFEFNQARRDFPTLTMQSTFMSALCRPDTHDHAAAISFIPV